MPNIYKIKFRHPNPSIKFPDGIGPPKKTVTGARIVNGRRQYQFSYYMIRAPDSAIESNGDDVNLENVKVICPLNDDKNEMGEDVIDFESYLEEQQGVIARENEIISSIEAIGEQNEEWMRLVTELMENNARKSIPSKDWRAFEDTIPEYRPQPAIGAPAIEANLPYLTSSCFQKAKKKQSLKS